MKPSFGLLAFALLIACGTTPDLHARPPQTRQGEGVIRSLDRRTHSFALECADGSVPRTLAWSRSTAIYVNGGEAGPEALRPGQRVTLRFRVPFFGPSYVSKIRVLSTSPQPATRKTES